MTPNNQFNLSSQVMGTLHYQECATTLRGTVTDAFKGGGNHVLLGSLFSLSVHAKLSPAGVLVLARFSR